MNDISFHEMDTPQSLFNRLTGGPAGLALDPVLYERMDGVGGGSTEVMADNSLVKPARGCYFAFVFFDASEWQEYKSLDVKERPARRLKGFKHMHKNVVQLNR